MNPESAEFRVNFERYIAGAFNSIQPAPALPNILRIVAVTRGPQEFVSPAGPGRYELPLEVKILHGGADPPGADVSTLADQMVGA